MNYLAILAAAVAQFIIGAIWYTPIFGRVWGEMHGFNELSPELQAEARKGMVRLLVVQFVFTVVTSVVLWVFITYLPSNWNVYALAAFFWIGFVVPTQVSAVLFGGTEPKWVMIKISIMAGASILCLEAAAFIIKAIVA